MMTALLLLLLTQPAAAPDAATVRGWFETGRYQDVVSVALTEATDPEVVYLVALGYERLERPAEAQATYARLAGRSAGDPWHAIGRSAVLLGESKQAEAVQAAREAVRDGAQLAAAQFQLGLALAAGRDYAGAAPAFEAAIAINPQPAYAHYNAGLSYYQVERIDLMARYFESFLKLAPNAPERTQVESIMRTVRGRR